MKTEGLWYRGGRAIALRPMEIPEPGYDEVVVVETAGAHDSLSTAMTLARPGAISNEKLVTHVGPVEKAEEVYRAGAKKTGGYLNGVITF